MQGTDFRHHFFVITGGPGTGKTTLLEALEASGYPCIPEVAREIIKEQIRIGGDALPWKNKARYTQLMLAASVRSYKQAEGVYSPDETVFFDRGIPDTLCYAYMTGLEIPEQMEAAVTQYPYRHTVFILTPWTAIYHTDEERKQTWEEALFTYEMMGKTYSKYGYKVIEVPRSTVEERVEFVKSKVTPDSRKRITDIHPNL